MLLNGIREKANLKNENPTGNQTGYNSAFVYVDVRTFSRNLRVGASVVSPVRLPDIFDALHCNTYLHRTYLALKFQRTTKTCVSFVTPYSIYIFCSRQTVKKSK